jgi:Cu/Zn superoxide dismutase
MTMGIDGRYVVAAAAALLSLNACKDTGEGEPAGGIWINKPATRDEATPGATEAPRPAAPTGGGGGMAAAAGMGGAGGMAAAAGMGGAGGAGGMGGAAGGGAGAGAGDASAVATIMPFGDGNMVTGTATFTQTGTDVMLVVSLMNCPDGEHGVHIHEGTSCADATMQGAHWGPTRGEGIPNVMCTGNAGMAMVTRAATDAMLAWSVGGDMASDIVGHAFVVHAATDSADPMVRIGCGVIEVE